MKKILLIFLFSYFSLFSTSIKYNDIVIERGNNYFISFIIEDITQNLDENSEVSLTFSYNGFMINPLSFEGTNIEVTDFKSDLNIEDIRKSILSLKLKIKDLDLIKNSIDTLFLLNIEALASQDSVSQIGLENFKIDEQEFTIDYIAGKIKTKSLMINLENDVSNVYPNPFILTSTIDLNIYYDSKLSINLYPIDARSMLYNIERNYFRILIYDSSNNEIKFNEGMQILAGRYKMVLFPNKNMISSGSYQIQIKLNENTYYKNFIYGE